jgi:hypothetical protein
MAWWQQWQQCRSGTGVSDLRAGRTRRALHFRRTIFCRGEQRNEEGRCECVRPSQTRQITVKGVELLPSLLRESWVRFRCSSEVSFSRKGFSTPLSYVIRDLLRSAERVEACDEMGSGERSTSNSLK